MSILIKNGRLIDPANKMDAAMDVLVKDSKISRVAKDIKAQADSIIDARGKIIAPGIVDMHVHLRQPGREDKETVATATAAAAKGGVTTVLAMPNTSPTIDCAESIELLKGIINKDAKVNVLTCASITKGRLGKELSAIAELRQNGAYALSDDGCSVENENLMLQALQEAAKARILTICHCEDKKLSGKGVINLGFNSTRLGLRGISNESEYKRIARDIDLAERCSAAVHIAHISCQESVEIISRAKKKGVKLTCETAPHYFSLTEDALLEYDTNMKMNHPLRNAKDLAAIKQGLRCGVIDAIASDHAPHTENEKDIEFERAEFGVVGLETELAVSITQLIDTKLLDWIQLFEKLSLNPSRILGIERGSLQEGMFADIVVISGEEEWQVKKSELVSKSKNSAFLGHTLKGVVDYTICNGKVVYKR